MISAFNKLVTYEGNEWEQFLDRMLLIEIFRPVIEYYRESDTIKCVILYIAYAYSLDSDKVHLGMDWLKNKKAIFDFVNVKPIASMEDDLIQLKSEAVLASIQRWVEYQDSDVFSQLMVLKDLRLEMQRSSLTEIKKSSGEIDYDQKFKNANHASALRQQIKDLESELVQNNKILKEAIGEVKATAYGRKSTFGPEKFAR